MNLRAGMMVRYVGSGKSLVGMEDRPDLHGCEGRITASRFNKQITIMQQVYTVDFYPDGEFIGKNLIPINPDNEAFGSWEDMMNSLTTEKVE
jgi:hypothetical protein